MISNDLKTISKRIFVLLEETPQIVLFRKLVVFDPQKNLLQVANEICDIAQASISHSKKVFVIGGPTRGTSGLQSKVLPFNAETHSHSGQLCSNNIFVGVWHHLYDSKIISKHIKTTAKVHKLFNEKILINFRKIDTNAEDISATKESSIYPF